MKRVLVAVVVGLVSLVAVTPASAGTSGVQHLHFKAGPYVIVPGANLILTQIGHVPKPTVDGYMVGFRPNLHYVAAGGGLGGIPRVDVIHLHHGVWLSSGAAGHGEGRSTYGPVYPFAAAGEEKTAFEMPPGYGYPVAAKDFWVLNYMIHNLTAKQTSVYITYDIDFVPATSPAAASITPVHPIWMDVMSAHIYPVFDVLRHSGHKGIYTFPDMAKNPYQGGPELNQFTVDQPGTLVGTAGHVHPGGLYDDLNLTRSGASPSGGAIKAGANTVRLFRSSGHYWDPRGPISWDMAMGATQADWRPRVKPGDVMSVHATYETKRASWYESMGIMVVWEAWDSQARSPLGGIDPFSHKLDQRSHLTHGHLAENNHHGGSVSLGIAAAAFRSCGTNKVIIGAFHYTPGDFTSTGSDRCAPTVRQGHSLTFINNDALAGDPGEPGLNPSSNYLHSIFHTVTACQNPCGLDTGISYPLANGPGGYDSTQLGLGTPASGKLSWSTPQNLAPGTYTYFCRIHPFMRGVFRIVRG
jgi:hypothetical protein